MYQNSPGLSLPRRILITTDSLGDTWSYSLALAGGLAGLGIDVGLATFGPPLSSEQRVNARNHQGIEVFESGFTAEWLSDFGRDQSPAAKWLLKLASQLDPDVVHLNGVLPSILPWQKPTVVVAHRCLASWWPDVRGTSLPKHWDFYRHQVALGLRSASLVVSTSRARLASLREHYGPFPVDRVIPFGWRAPQGVEAKRGFIIAAQGLWSESCNLQALELCAPFLSWPAFCSGETLDEAGARTKVQARNMCCLGPLSEQDLEAWLLQSSIFVLPARYPDCQISILRAAAAGCALVLGNHPVLKEVWQDAAVFVPPEEPEAIRLALERLIRDPQRRRDLADRARQRANELSLSVMIGEYCVAYHEAMVSGTRRSGVLSHAAVGA